MLACLKIPSTKLSMNTKIKSERLIVIVFTFCTPPNLGIFYSLNSVTMVLVIASIHDFILFFQISNSLSKEDISAMRV